MIVGSRMLCRRRVAAADVPALCAPPKMQPPTAALKALYATIAARCDARINAGCAAFSPDARFVVIMSASRRCFTKLTIWKGGPAGRREPADKSDPNREA
jgi:hypothetical protein